MHTYSKFHKPLAFASMVLMGAFTISSISYGSRLELVTRILTLERVLTGKVPVLKTKYEQQINVGLSPSEI